MRNFKKKYGEYALVTGTTSGIGKAFAYQLAQKGLNLVLVARRQQMLDEIVRDITSRFNVKALALPLDLTSPEALHQLDVFTRDLSVGLLIPNAGFELHGHFLNNNLAEHTKMMQLNMVVPLQMAHLFGSRMARQKRGGILFISSTFGLQSVPYFANYAATKAYILALGQALREEMRPYKVDVTVLAPGLTRTAMVDHMQGVDMGKMPVKEMTPEKVAKTGLRALCRHSLAIPGGRNKMFNIMGKYTTPRYMLAKMFGMLVKRAMDKKLVEYNA